MESDWKDKTIFNKMKLTVGIWNGTD